MAGLLRLFRRFNGSAASPPAMPAAPPDPAPQPEPDTAPVTASLAAPLAVSRPVLRRPRDFARWGGDPLEFRDVAAFEAGFAGDSGPFSIDLDGLPFDGMFRRGTTDTLFVFFTAAVSLKPGFKLPVFNWVGQSRRCQGSALFLADPLLALAEDLNLAWYLGTFERPLQTVMARVVTVAARSVGASRLVFVGTSGGGFPALWAAEYFPGSVAYVNAPTTTLIRTYRSPALERFRRVAMSGREIATFPGVLQLPVGQPADAGTKVIITQNANDTLFVEHHLTPFLRRTGLEWTGADIVSDKLLLRVGDPARWGQGHVMPPNDVSRVILQALDRVEGPGFAGLDLPALHRRMLDADPVPADA